MLQYFWVGWVEKFMFTMSNFDGNSSHENRAMKNFGRIRKFPSANNCCVCRALRVATARKIVLKWLTLQKISRVFKHILIFLLFVFSNYITLRDNWSALELSKEKLISRWWRISDFQFVESSGEKQVLNRISFSLKGKCVDFVSKLRNKGEKCSIVWITHRQNWLPI